MINLQLTNEIYSEQNVNTAIEAYNQIACIRAIHGKRSIVVMISHCKFNEEQTAKEFENYLIGLENS